MRDGRVRVLDSCPIDANHWFRVFKSTVTANRKNVLHLVHVQLKKYIEKLPAFVVHFSLLGRFSMR